MNEPVFWLAGYVIGIFVGYLIWAPDTAFKQSLVNGLSLKFIWGRWIR